MKKWTIDRRYGVMGIPEVRVSDFYVDKATVKIPESGSIRVIPIGDLHLGDRSVDLDYVRKVFKELDKPHTYGIILGDIIQGIKSDKPEMMAGTPRLDTQVLTAEKFLKYFAEEGKLLAAVAGNHEAHARKDSTLDEYFIMLRSLRGVDGSSLPLLYNGGYLTLQFKGGGEYKIKVNHNPGSGGSAKNGVGAQRFRGMETTIDNPDHPDHVTGGHTHGRAMISREIRKNILDGSEIIQTLSAGGTAQGIDPKNPNLFLNDMAASASLPGLPVTILSPKRKQVASKDVWGLNNSARLLEAVRLWDNIESRNMGDEVMEQIHRKTKPTRATFKIESSRPVERANDGADIKSRSYDVARWQVETYLPIATYFLGGTRFGCSTTNTEKASQVTKLVANDPESFVIVTRGMVDKGLGAKLERQGYLDRMLDLLDGAGEKNKILSLLIDEDLRAKSWKRTLGKKEERDNHQAIITGDYIQARFPNIPLIVNNAFVELNLGGVRHRILVRDGVGLNGSTMNPFAGLEAQIFKLGIRPDVAVGGHMPGVGVSQAENGIVVAPGGYARWIGQGEKNEQPIPEGGQSVIFSPRAKAMFACATFAEGVDTHRALVYLEGLQHLSAKDQKNILNIKPRKSRK